MKKFFIILVCVIFLIIFINFNTYQSSPGYTTKEYSDEFYANAPTCMWLSILLNKRARSSDAPWKSLCIWYLDRK